MHDAAITTTAISFFTIASSKLAPSRRRLYRLKRGEETVGSQSAVTERTRDAAIHLSASESTLSYRCSKYLLIRWRLFGSRFLSGGCSGLCGEGFLMDAVDQLLELSSFVQGSWILCIHHE